MIVQGPTRKAIFSAEPGDHISSWLEHGRYYEADLLEAIRALDLGGTYVDVGAHVGNHTIYFALECKAERVLSIEPFETSYGYLIENVISNEQQGVVVPIHALIHPNWESAAWRGFGQERNTGTAHFEEFGTIPVFRLDDLLPTRGITFIKIDVEGSSLDVLRTAIRTITRQRPYLAIEGIDGDEVKAVGQFLRPLGYTADGPYAITPVWIWKP